MMSFNLNSKLWSHLSYDCEKTINVLFLPYFIGRLTVNWPRGKLQPQSLFSQNACCHLEAPFITLSSANESFSALVDEGIGRYLITLKTPEFRISKLLRTSAIVSTSDLDLILNSIKMCTVMSRICSLLKSVYSLFIRLSRCFPLWICNWILERQGFTAAPCCLSGLYFL